ncbi:MAG: ribonuclease HII, partial [Candidatus Buchananbacteria bacterium]
AKVFRDDLMTKFASQYPDYGFDRHKGYGTKLHQKNLEQNGICAIHRRSYQPIKKLCVV